MADARTWRYQKNSKENSSGVVESSKSEDDNYLQWKVETAMGLGFIPEHHE